MKPDDTPVNDSQERSIFEDFGDVVPLHSQSPQSPVGTEDYSATNLTQSEEGITFCHEDGTFTIKYYRHLQEVVCIPPYRMLSLMYMDCIYLLEGRNLHLLLSRLRRNKLGEVYCLDPAQRHDGDEAVILRITRRSYEEMESDIRDSGALDEP